MFIFLYVYCSVMLLLTIYFACRIRRGSKVFRYRLHIINLIKEASFCDIIQGRSYEWRYDVFENVSFEQMVTKFWKPLDSFYPDMSFIDPYAKEKL